MTIKDFNLLEIDVYDGDKLIYNGMCEDAPEELKDKQVRVRKIDNKTLIIDLIED